MSLAVDLRAAMDPVITFADAFGEDPHDWQVDYLRERRPSVILKGRQVGATQAAAALAIHTTRYRRDVDVVIVSPTQKQSGEITTRARAGRSSCSSIPRTAAGTAPRAAPSPRWSP